MLPPRTLTSEMVPTADAKAGPRSVSAPVVALLGRRSIVWLTVTVVASLVLAAVELSISIVLQLFLKSVGVLGSEIRLPLGDFIQSAGALAFALVVIALVRSACQFLVAQASCISMETINARLRRLAVWQMLLRPSDRFVSAASMNARVGDFAVKTSVFFYYAINITCSGIQAVALVPIMFVAARGEAMIAAGGLLVVGLFVLGLNRATRQASASVPAELRVLTEGIAHVARNALLVRVLRTQDLEHRRLATSIDAYAKHLIHAGFLGSLSAVVPPFAGILLILGIVAVSQRVFHTHGVTLLAFLYLFIRFVTVVANVAGLSAIAAPNWPMVRDSLDYVSGFRRDEIEAAMHVGEALVGRAVERPVSREGQAPSIELAAVSFAYPGSTTEVLRDLSIEISAGSQFGIVGPSGCGKSTLLALVLGILQPTRGAVRVRGRSPTEVFGDTKTRVGYVGADPFLVAGTIRENLRYGLSREATDADLLEALALAHLRDTVEALPRGLDHVVTAEGVGLSAGQKQRLCLARALLNEPHVLVLDEMSANLDVDIEAEIAESLKSLRGKSTTIIVSHRRGILKYADRVMALGQED